VTDRAILSLTMVRLGNLYFFFHLEDFRVTLRAFNLVRIDMCFMAEENRSLLLGFILYVSSAYLFLSEGYAQGHKAYDADADDENSPEFITHFLTSFLSIFPLAGVLPARKNLSTLILLSKGRFVKKNKKQKNAIILFETRAGREASWKGQWSLCRKANAREASVRACRDFHAPLHED
jgi:hypothetical protein